MHFRTAAWRQKLPPAMRRRRTIYSVVEAGHARPAIERRASPAEIRRRTAAHCAIERCHTTLQLLVNLLELIDALQLIDRGTESGENANQQKREPNLQAPADGFEDHGACFRWSLDFIRCNIPAPVGSRSDRVPAFCGG